MVFGLDVVFVHSSRFVPALFFPQTPSNQRAKIVFQRRIERSSDGSAIVLGRSSHVKDVGLAGFERGHRFGNSVLPSGRSQESIPAAFWCASIGGVPTVVHRSAPFPGSLISAFTADKFPFPFQGSIIIIQKKQINI
jgi:hypothetical protein